MLRVKTMFHSAVGLALGAVMAVSLAPASRAQDWPTSSDRIQLVVPFNTGGSADRLARGLAPFLSKEMSDAAVTVINRPGASGALGAAWFMQQPMDGSVFLVMQATPFLANAILQTDIPVEWEDFQVVNTQWLDYAILAVPADSEIANFDDFVTKLKSGEGALTAGGMSGGASLLQQYLMLDMLGVPRENVRLVTYDGGGPLRTAIAGGHLDFTFVAANGSEVIRDRIRSIAVVNADPVENWEGPLINEALANYGVNMPIFSAYTTSVIAHAAFKKEHPLRYQAFVDALERTMKRDDYQRWLKEKPDRRHVARSGAEHEAHNRRF